MENIRQTVKRVWGYDALLPLQEEAIGAVLARRDSIVILPTGGGKSLCYQAPAAVRPSTWSFIREIRGETTTASFPIAAAGA